MGKETAKWFLGAVSGAGFYSLYDSFFREGDFLWVIKGGPGCGKSSFMRRIGELAEEAGMPVEYILCAADPNSLDGVYLPSRRVGWVDGTEPHIMDPDCFGASGAYLDLGAYTDLAALADRREDLFVITEQYRDLRMRARAAISAASLTAGRNFPDVVGPGEMAASARRALSVAERELPKRKRGVPPGDIQLRFLSSFCHEGRIVLTGTLSMLCKRIYLLDDQYGLATPFLAALLAEASERGVDAIYCPSPILTERAEALILPGLSLGFLAAPHGEEPPLKYARHLRLDAMVDASRLREARSVIRADAKLTNSLLASAQASLAASKELHDELEAIYNPNVDFAAVMARAESEFASLM